MTVFTHKFNNFNLKNNQTNFEQSYPFSLAPVVESITLPQAKGIHVLRSLITAILLFALWFLMSGITKPLTLSLGAGSALFAVFIVRRMDNAADAERLAVRLLPFAFIKYLAWLMGEIAKSNWAVTKIIMSPKMNIKQNMFEVPFTQKSDLGQTVFANSITLTPGTISVEVEAPDDNAAIADMDARVTQTEGQVS